MEQHFWTHAEEAVYDPEREYHGHAVDVPVPMDSETLLKERVNGSQAQEPRQGSDGELNVDFLEVVVDDGETALDERFEYALIEESAMH